MPEKTISKCRKKLIDVKHIEEEEILDNTPLSKFNEFLKDKDEKTRKKISEWLEHDDSEEIRNDFIQFVQKEWNKKISESSMNKNNIL